METRNSVQECPVCGTNLKPNQKFCPTCGESVVQEAPASFDVETYRCSGCGREMSESAPFCAVCGTPNNRQMVPSAPPSTKELVTVVNPPPISDGNMTNTYNSYEERDMYVSNPDIDRYNMAATRKKKRGGMIVGICIGVVAVAGIITGVTSYNHQVTLERQAATEKETYEAYISTAEQFYYLALSDGILLEDVGNDVKSYWYDAIWNDDYSGSIDLAVAYALSDNESNVDTLETDASTLDAYYETLSDIPSGDYYNEALQLYGYVEDVYYAYADFLDVVLSPEGSLSDFSDDFSDADSDMADALEKLSSALS